MLNPTSTQHNSAAEDQALIGQIKAGNFAAFEQLVDRYDRQVFCIIARYVQNAEDAKDLFQEVLIKVYRGLPNFQHRSSFSTWLFRVTTNVCLSHHIKKKAEPYFTTAGHTDAEDEDHRTTTLPHTSTPERQLEQKELSQRVNRVIGQLPPKQRYVFTLKYLEGYKIREIAGMMKCHEGTVKRYLFNAMRTVRDDLQSIRSETR
jgi:RNA polymerase sigma-70 factor, ECF subfamily